MQKSGSAATELINHSEGGSGAAAGAAPSFGHPHPVPSAGFAVVSLKSNLLQKKTLT